MCAADLGFVLPTDWGADDLFDDVPILFLWSPVCPLQYYGISDCLFLEYSPNGLLWASDRLIWASEHCGGPSYGRAHDVLILGFKNVEIVATGGHIDLLSWFIMNCIIIVYIFQVMHCKHELLLENTVYGVREPPGSTFTHKHHASQLYVVTLSYLLDTLSNSSFGVFCHKVGQPFFNFIGCLLFEGGCNGVWLLLSLAWHWNHRICRCLLINYIMLCT